MPAASKAELTRPKMFPDQSVEERQPTLFLDATNEQMEGLDAGTMVEITVKGSIKSLSKTDDEGPNGLTIVVEQMEIYPEDSEKAEVRKQVASMADDEY